MSKPILIIKNISHEGPGLLEQILKEKNFQYTIIDLHKGDTIPNAENFGAVVVLGGPDSANDQNEKMETELARIREILTQNIPYLGICLGLQTLVKAAGGKVVKSSTKEVGFRGPDGNFFTVKLTEEGKQDPLFKGLKASLHVFHLHGETVELTKNMTLLATGKFCHNQIAKVGPTAYGLQCHFELTSEMLEEWLKIDPDLLQLNQNSLQDVFKKLKNKYTFVGKKLFENFLTLAGYL